MKIHSPKRERPNPLAILTETLKMDGTRRCSTIQCDLGPKKIAAALILGLKINALQQNKT